MASNGRSQTSRPSQGHIEAVRRFSRWYSQRLGFLDESLLSTGHSLPEARVLYEVHYEQTRSAHKLARDLDLDRGHVSRVLGRLEDKGLIRRTPSVEDGRRRVIEATDSGLELIATLNERASTQVCELLEGLPEARQHRLVSAMRAIEQSLEGATDERAPVVLRPHRLGDLGWVVSRHGEIYGQEYGWDETFEGLVASVASDFLAGFDSGCERSWIAEIDGERVGSIFATRRSPTTAQLRMLLLDRKARGRGLGRRLVEECVAFARNCGYRNMMLETVSILEAARGIYRSVGFEIVHREDKHTWGHDLVHETWEMNL